MKIESLQRKVDFDRVFKKNQHFGNRHFTFLYMKNQLDHNRLGIMVSKKVSKKAVVRNRIRRQIREAYRLQMDGFASGVDCIIIAKGSCVNGEYKDLYKSLGHLFYKTGLKVSVKK